MKPASRLKDDTVTIGFTTQEEISTELFSHIDAYRRWNGWLWFGPDKPLEVELPTSNAVPPGDISDSQRLRRALYALHLKRGGTKDDFQAFYARQLEQIIQKVIDSFD